jgi:putative membrane protein
MMYWGNGDWNWAAWLVMTASMVLFWGLVAWVVVTVIRRPSDNPRRPEDVLADRYARGEIDDDEFGRRRDALRAKH